MDSQGAILRPKSIIMFERLFLASTVLGLVSFLMSYGTLRALAISHGTSPGAQFIAGLAAFLWNILIWFLIARRASNIAKWIFVVLLAYSVVAMVWGIQWYINLGAYYALCTGFLTLLEIAAAAYLFRGDAVIWLKSGGKLDEVDPQIFR